MRVGKKIGAENVERFKAYLASIDALPARHGKIHVTAVAEAAGLDRQTLYKNAVIRKLFEEAVAEKGLRGIDPGDNQGDSKLTAKLERKIAELEAKNAALIGENWELRRENADFRQVEALLEQGKRLIR